jgi:hypothetical protein
LPAGANAAALFRRSRPNRAQPARDEYRTEEQGNGQLPQFILLPKQ